MDYHQGEIYTSIALIFLEEASIHWHFVFRYYSPLNGGGKGKPCLHYSLCFSLFFSFFFFSFFFSFGPVFSPPHEPPKCTVLFYSVLFSILGVSSRLHLSILGIKFLFELAKELNSSQCLACCIRLRLLVACLLVV